MYIVDFDGCITVLSQERKNRLIKGDLHTFNKLVMQDDINFVTKKLLKYKKRNNIIFVTKGNIELVQLWLKKHKLYCRVILENKIIHSLKKKDIYISHNMERLKRWNRCIPNTSYFIGDQVYDVTDYIKEKLK